MRAYFIVGLFIAALALATGFTLADNAWQAKWDAAQAAALKQQVDVIKAAAQKHKDQITTLEGINREAQKELNAAINDSRRADAANDSLQQQLENYLRRPSSCADNTSTTAERAAAATDRLVLSQLFSRVNERAGELAKIADSSRVRGLTCEASYEAVYKGQ